MNGRPQWSKIDTKPLKRVAAIRSSNVDKIVTEGEQNVRLCNYVDVYYNERITDKISFSAGSAGAREIEKFALRSGDVIITKDSETPDDIAVPALVEASADGVVCGYHLAMLRPDRALMRGDFLFWCLKARPIIDEFSIRAQGITRFGLTLDGIGGVPVPSPDLDTQEAIATFLDRQTARIDQLIDKKQRFLALTEEHWRSTLDHLICGRGSDSLSTPVTHAAISSIPSSWKLPPLKYLTDINRPIMYGIVLPGPNVEHGVMIVKGGDVKPERLHPDRLCKTTFEIERGYERSRLKCGDLLITIRGGIGDVEIVPPEIGGANLTQDVARIAPRFGVHSVWLRYALLAPSVFSPLEAKALGAAVRGINIFDLKCVRVPTPPIGEQIEIARRLETDALQFADLKQKIARHSVIIREFRSALITAAVTGQIDVTTWGKQGQTDRRLDQIQEAMRA